MQAILLLLTCNTRERGENENNDNVDSPHLEDGETGQRQEALAVQHCQLVVAQVPDIHDIHHSLKLKCP